MKPAARLLVLTLAAACPLAAQQLPYQTQFRQLYAYINPAAINSDYFLYEYNMSVNGSYRLQWSAQPQTPRTLHVAGEYVHNAAAYGNTFSLAGGAAILQDRVGPLALTGVYARLAALLGNDPYLGASRWASSPAPFSIASNTTASCGKRSMILTSRWKT